MILTVNVLLSLIALVFVVLSATNRSQLWPAVLCLVLIHLLAAVPR